MLIFFLLESALYLLTSLFGSLLIFPFWKYFRVFLENQSCVPKSEVQKLVNPVILDDRKYIQNQGLAENISKT